MQGLAASLAVYFERRMARILLLGVVSGFPWVLIGSSLTLWLKEEGLGRGTIGWAGLIFGVYAFNFLPDYVLSSSSEPVGSVYCQVVEILGSRTWRGIEFSFRKGTA